MHNEIKRMTLGTYSQGAVIFVTSRVASGDGISWLQMADGWVSEGFLHRPRAIVPFQPGRTSAPRGSESSGAPCGTSSTSSTALLDESELNLLPHSASNSSRSVAQPAGTESSSIMTRNPRRESFPRGRGRQPPFSATLTSNNEYEERIIDSPLEIRDPYLDDVVFEDDFMEQEELEMLSAVQCRMEAMASTLASLQDEVAVTQALLSGIVAGKSIHDTFQLM